MGKDYIRYDLLAQEALRGVVRQVLTTTAQQGLPGEHHFYISIVTEAPGVEMSDRLRGEYPDEMTIILQHQFWDLEVQADGFTVTLSFGGSPERLVVPFSAIKGFFDPSVQFGLEFVLPGDEEAEGDEEPETSPDEAHDADNAPGEPAAETRTTDPDEAPVETTDTDAAEADDDGATVVSLDAFRKKG